MILADKRDYKEGYEKHYRTYQFLDLKNGTIVSKRLLLVYSVECGLKYKMLKEWEIESLSEIKEILKDKNDPRHKILGTHNLRRIIKELGQEGQFRFPQIKTSHKDDVSSEEYHQMLRYGIRSDDRNKREEDQYEEVLKQIADWIQEEI